MATTVPVSFVEQYEAEVRQVYQRESSLLRGTVRTRTQVNASRIYFPILGKGEATQKARHADVVPMGLEHRRAMADMEDHYAPEYIDDLDQAKLNWSLASEYARASGFALGRKTDSIILDALDEAENEVSLATLDPDGDNSLTLAAMAAATSMLNVADVPMDSMRYAVVSPELHSQLLMIPQATSSDFTTSQLLMNAREPAMWMGFRWIMHTGLPDGVHGFLYHQQSVGLGIAQDAKTQVDWVAQKVAWLVNSWMSMGATIVDPTGVIKIVEE